MRGPGCCFPMIEMHILYARKAIFTALSLLAAGVILFDCAI